MTKSFSQSKKSFAEYPKLYLRLDARSSFNSLSTNFLFLRIQCDFWWRWIYISYSFTVSCTTRWSLNIYSLVLCITYLFTKQTMRIKNQIIFQMQNSLHLLLWLNNSSLTTTSDDQATVVELRRWIIDLLLPTKDKKNNWI